MGLIEEISEYLQKGRAITLRHLYSILDENLENKEILYEGLLSGMNLAQKKTMKYSAGFLLRQER